MRHSFCRTFYVNLAEYHYRFSAFIWLSQAVTIRAQPATNSERSIRKVVSIAVDVLSLQSSEWLLQPKLHRENADGARSVVQCLVNNRRQCLSVSAEVGCFPQHVSNVGCRARSFQLCVDFVLS